MPRSTKEVFEKEVDPIGNERSTTPNPDVDRYYNIGSTDSESDSDSDSDAGGRLQGKDKRQKPGHEYITKGGREYNATKVLKIDRSAIKTTEDNYPRFSLIACSAPSLRTFDSFCDMVATGNNVDGIVVLGPAEPGRLEDYWSKTPSLPGVFNMSLCEYDIANKGSKPLEGGSDVGTENVLEFTNKLGKTRSKTITLYHYNAWKDRGKPTNPEDFENFIKKIYKKKHRKLIVHCSAGVGRTGTFTACLDALIESDQHKPPADIVKELRKHRTIMVQTPGQFDIVCKFMARNCVDLKKLGLKAPEYTDDIDYDEYFGDGVAAKLGIPESKRAKQ